MPGWIRGLIGQVSRADAWAAAALERACRVLWRLLSAARQRLQPVLAASAARLRPPCRWVGARAAAAVARVAPHFPWSCRFGVVATTAAAFAIRVWMGGPLWAARRLDLTDAHLHLLRRAAVFAPLEALSTLGAVVVALAAIAALLAFVRCRPAFWVLKAAAAAYAVLVLLALRVTWSVPAALCALDAAAFTTNVRNELWVRGTWKLFPPVLLGALFLLMLVLRSVSNFYRGEALETPQLGDRILRNLRTHGKDPVYRKSVYRSGLLHILAIFVLPFLVGRGCGWMKPYGVPLGSGTQAIEVVKIRKIKKKIEKKYVVNMNTAISFYVPKIDDSMVFEDVDKLTENQYQAQAVGKLGAGGGKEGGWPNGMANAKVRFIRLEYDGGDWDQDMGYGADYNMLMAFREITGFPIATKTESVRIPQLKRFPKNRAPPFVYLTGGLKGGINLSQAEVKVLREYCLNMGGMIFADNGGGSFNTNFRALLRRVFPDLPVVEIAHDDVILHQPFSFPRGAPPLWHHSGNEMLGVKYQGRWVVVYHQGDINDAWKDGHSGASDAVAGEACRLGINIINYSFNQYMQINFGGIVPK